MRAVPGPTPVRSALGGNRFRRLINGNQHAIAFAAPIQRTVLKLPDHRTTDADRSMNAAFTNHLVRALPPAIDGVLVPGKRSNASDDAGEFGKRGGGQRGAMRSSSASDSSLLAQ
jgi:hypothetical protein